MRDADHESNNNKDESKEGSPHVGILFGFGLDPFLTGCLHRKMMIIPIVQQAAF